MHVSTIAVKYECKNLTCKNSKTLGFNYGLINIEDIGKYLEFSKICNKCNNVMTVAVIYTKTLEIKNNNANNTSDSCKYGDPINGVWVCPVHNTIKYYPNAIKMITRMVEKKISIGSVGVFCKNYEKIIEKGFPWKCPVCDTNLHYYREEDLFFGYS